MASCKASKKRTSRQDDFSCWDEYINFLQLDLVNEKESFFSGQDHEGAYQAHILMYREDDLGHMLVTKRYFYSSRRLKRVVKTLDEDLIWIEDWSEDGAHHWTSSCAGEDGWVWKKWINPKTGAERLLINRESYVFWGMPENLIVSLEAGEFHSKRLLEIRWEDEREAILEILGASKVASELPAVMVDSLGPNRLLRMEWRDRWGDPRMDDWSFLEFHCASTGKVSYLRVPPRFNDIMSAIAWTFGMDDKEQYQLEVET